MQKSSIIKRLTKYEVLGTTPGIKIFCQRGQGHGCNLQEGQLSSCWSTWRIPWCQPGTEYPWPRLFLVLAWPHPPFSEIHIETREETYKSVSPMIIIINVSKSKVRSVGVPLTLDLWGLLSIERATPSSWTEEFDDVGKEGSGETGGNIHGTSVDEDGKSNIWCTCFLS